MPSIPFLGRLAPRDYTALILGFLFLAFESALHVIILFLPKEFIGWCYRVSREVFRRAHDEGRGEGEVGGVGDEKKKEKEEKRMSDRLLKARDFGELCEVHGYTHEEHVVLTKDGYLLNLHRLPSKRGEKSSRPGTSTGKPVVYLHHGLLMNSEIWVCLTDRERALPFVLVESGYDVWLGNNRGNKYSKKSMHHGPNESKFWDYSMDEFAWHDIPDSIHHILGVTKVQSLSYIGFSQGTAQAFAALSIHPELNEKVNVFIALAPALSPPGLAQPLVDSLMKSSPTLLYLVFGRKSILSSATMWQSILYPPIFAWIIDTGVGVLFKWTGENISPLQKIAAYAHLYSFTSVKSVVHWFQIMRNATFQMYDDDTMWSGGPGAMKSRVSSYRPVRFPTRNIVTPVVLLWGDCDSLVHIETMLGQLPEHTVARQLRTYEHLDVIWGRDVDKDVIPVVSDVLERYNSLQGTKE